MVKTALECAVIAAIGFGAVLGCAMWIMSPKKPADWEIRPSEKLRNKFDR